MPWPDRILKAVSTQLRVSLTVSSWSWRTKDLGSCYRNYNCRKFGKLSARFWKCFFFKLNNQIPHQILFLILKYQFTFPSLFSKSRTGRNRVIINFLFFFGKLSGKSDQPEKLFQIARKVSSDSRIGFYWSKLHILHKLKNQMPLKWMQW